MEINGKVHVIVATETVGAKDFRKRTIVVATDEQYVQYIPIDFVQDKCSVLDGYKIGQQVKVSVNVRGNEYNGKYYVKLQGWKIEKTGEPPMAVEKPQVEEKTDDLPF